MHRRVHIACVALALSGGACSLIYGLDDLGSGAVEGAGGGGANPPLGDECSSPDDCAPPASRCIESLCDRGYCVYTPLPDLQPLSSQVAGNCMEKVCDGAGGERDIFVDDPPGSANPCISAVCVNGVADPRDAAVGVECTLGICDGVGRCVECVVDGLDDYESSYCDGGLLCVKAQCAPAFCVNGTFDANEGETDVDCGGACPACDDGLRCLVGSDCVSGVCGGPGQPTCQVPACDDLVHNGSETGVDCGGSCPPCAAGQGCLGANDCQSGVCVGGLCQAPSCTDGVRNGTETDVDCGGGSCPGCKPGERCAVANDCAGVLTCNQEGRCVHPCQDGVLNYQETDIDCGGPLCAPCPLGRRCGCAEDCETKLCCSDQGAKLCVRDGECRGTLIPCLQSGQPDG